MNASLLLDREAVRGRIGGRLAAGLRARARTKVDLTEWGMRFFPHYFTLEPSPKHRELGHKLKTWSRERGVRAAIEAPRDFAKSTYLTFLYALWSICEGTEQYIIILSDVHGQAVKHVKGIRFELENNTELADAYPNACGAGEEWTGASIVTRNGIRVEALGAGQKIRGRRQRQERPTLIVIDDAEGDEAAYSSSARTTIREWATKGVFKAGQPGTNILVAGTVIHRECLVAHCANLPGWRVMSFKAIITWPERMDLWEEWEKILQDNTKSEEDSDELALAFYRDHMQDMDLGAEVIWPHRESLYDLMYMRASEGRTAFESEKQNNPIDPSKCEWDPTLFEGQDLWFDDWPKGDLICATMALDPSKGKSDKSGDYQAIIMLGVDSKGVLYVDADIRRRNIRDMVETFVELGRGFRPDVAVVEEEQFQELLIPECENAAVRNRVVMPIEGINTGKVPKKVRCRRLSTYITRRRIRYKRRSVGVRLLRQQLMDFPNGDHDDGPDALEMAVRRSVELLADHAGAGKVESPY